MYNSQTRIMLDYSHTRIYNVNMRTPIIIVDPDTKIDKYSVLKWIFGKVPFRCNDELTAILNDLKDEKTYGQLDIINSLIALIKDNVLENVAALDCVKIVIE